jgi:hypothetical protein
LRRLFLGDSFLGTLLAGALRDWPGSTDTFAAPACGDHWTFFSLCSAGFRMGAGFFGAGFSREGLSSESLS